MPFHARSGTPASRGTALAAISLDACLPCLALRDETRHVLHRMRQAGSPARVGCLSRRDVPIITYQIGACCKHSLVAVVQRPVRYTEFLE